MTDERKEINESAATEASDPEVAIDTEETADVGALRAEAAKAKEYLERLLRTAADFEN
jgi:hypothetical protein